MSRYDNSDDCDDEDLESCDDEVDEVWDEDYE
jgi:hypothetical protein